MIFEIENYSILKKGKFATASYVFNFNKILNETVQTLLLCLNN